MAAKSVGTKVFDFVKIGNSIPASLRPQLNGLRAQYAAAQTKLAQTPENVEAIDFAGYKAKIAAPGFVEEVQKVFEGVKYTYPADVNTAAINASQKASVAEVEALIKESQEQVKAIEAQLAALNAEKPLDEITTNEYLADKPELAAEIEAEIKDNNFA